MSTKHAPGPQQFEHDGFNNPQEVEAAVCNAFGPSKSERALAASLNSINTVRANVRHLQQRFRVLEGVPGGRAWLSPAERVEYDLIGALLSDLRAVGAAK